MQIISFDVIDPSLSVRVTDDNLMVALDLFSVLTRRDRKKASQTLARIGSKPETAALLTLKPSAHTKHPRKLISFAHAVQLLLIVPKRTASLETSRIIADVLVRYFQISSGFSTRSTDTPASDDIATLERRAAVLKSTFEIERQRSQLPLEQIKQCMELTGQCAPLTEEDVSKFKLAISAHMSKHT